MLKILTNFGMGLFNFFVGDWIILIGVAITLAVAVLLEDLNRLNGLNWLGGAVLFLGVAFTLILTLQRERA